MSPNARIPAPHRRRIALSIGMAVGAAFIGASISMGTAPVAGADVLNTDPVSDLIGALDPSALSAASYTPLVDGLVDTALPAAPTWTDAVSELVAAFDPNSFSPTTGGPTDLLGILAYGLDNYFLGPFGIDNLIAPYVAEIIASLPPSGAESVDVSPVSDLIAALDPGAVSAGVADLAAPTATALVDPVIDGLLNSGLSLF